MPKRRRAQSILEFLTARNPTIPYVEGTKDKNTENKRFVKPVALKPWTGFTYAALETIFGGELLKEAQKRQPRDALPHYPHIDQSVTTQSKSHVVAVDIMGKWNSTIVLAALRAVEDFQPCIWVPDFGIDLSKEATESTETRAGVNKEKNTTRGLKGSNKGNKSQSGTDKEKSRKRRKQPDGGAVSLEEEPKRKRLGKFEEFFPKEIKTASNWNSQKLRNGEYTDKETGKWIGTVGESNENAPIRQAYTYCVDFRCRYGCILTTREAFMFRIKPRETDIAAPKDDLTLVERVQVDGLMEFVSVPWDNGCDTDHHEYRQWTVNLALWFMHILAGNNHKLGWDWGLRDDEFVKIKQQESPKRGTESQSLDSRTSAMKKRSRAEQAREEAQAQEIIDNPNFSFTSSVIRQPSMSLGGYTESLVSDNNSTIDGDLESRPLKKRLRSAFSQVDKGQGGSSGSGLGS